MYIGLCTGSTGSYNSIGLRASKNKGYFFGVPKPRIVVYGGLREL